MWILRFSGPSSARRVEPPTRGIYAPSFIYINLKRLLEVLIYSALFLGAKVCFSSVCLLKSSLSKFILRVLALKSEKLLLSVKSCIFCLFWCLIMFGEMSGGMLIIGFLCFCYKTLYFEDIMCLISTWFLTLFKTIVYLLCSYWQKY